MYKKLIENKYSNFKEINDYFSLIEEYNMIMNLTGFSGERLWKEGIYESILSLESLDSGKLLDIGAGAGFPSVPWNIVNPKINLTIFEPIAKRANFLKIVKEKLDLNFGINIIRAEDSKDFETFDFVTARAVAPLRILIEISHPLLKVGGEMIFLKGSKYKEEIIQAESILKKFNMNVKIEKIQKDAINTYLIRIKKTNKTPKGIPRNWAQIKKDSI